MDLPALIMVNPVLDELLVFCLWNDGLNEWAEVTLRGVLHCRAEAEISARPGAE